MHDAHAHDKIDSEMMSGADPTAQKKSSPDSISPLVVWLRSSQSEGVDGTRLRIQSRPPKISVAEGWSYGPSNRQRRGCGRARSARSYGPGAQLPRKQTMLAPRLSHHYQAH